MKVGIVSTHSWKVPNEIHTGDGFYADLAMVLDEMGHEVTFFAPNGSYVPPNGRQLTMPCSFGQGHPSSADCEQECYNKYSDVLRSLDVVHDFSITKRIVENLWSSGYENVISTPMGGSWNYSENLHNLVLHSEAMKQRGLRGATDYEGTPTPDAAGPPQKPIKNAHVVNLGIDTNYYTPTYEKKSSYLWVGRWHPIRGYKFAIELAKETGIQLILAGQHPDREITQHQKECCFEALKLAKGTNNIEFEWLPKDPYHHERKMELLQGAKALILPTQFQEPWGLTSSEALACGTPVITTNYGSASEIITDGVTGYVVNNDIKAFAEALNKVHKINPAICREYAVRKFDRKVMAANYVVEYNRVIAGERW